MKRLNKDVVVLSGLDIGKKHRAIFLQNIDKKEWIRCYKTGVLCVHYYVPIAKGGKRGGKLHRDVMKVKIQDFSYTMKKNVWGNISRYLKIYSSEYNFKHFDAHYLNKVVSVGVNKNVIEN